MFTQVTILCSIRVLFARLLHVHKQQPIASTHHHYAVLRRCHRRATAASRTVDADALSLTTSMGDDARGGCPVRQQNDQPLCGGCRAAPVGCQACADRARSSLGHASLGHAAACAAIASRALRQLNMPSASPPSGTATGSACRLSAWPPIGDAGRRETRRCVGVVVIDMDDDLHWCVGAVDVAALAAAFGVVKNASLFRLPCIVRPDEDKWPCDKMSRS
jgi:hypothetical protein